MVTIKIDVAKCDRCKTCVEICPASIFELRNDELNVVNSQDCIECYACEEECPQSAIQVII